MKSDRRIGWPLAALSLALALGACQDEKKATTAGSAGGEVLPGSASDAMLPVDQVRSQPPLAPKATASASENGQKPKSGAATKSDTPASDEAPVEPAPVATAEAE